MCSDTEMEISLMNQIRRSRGEGEDFQLGYLLPWTVWPEGSQELPAGFGDQDKAMDGKKKIWGEDLCDPLEITTQMEWAIAGVLQIQESGWGMNFKEMKEE